MSVVKKVYKCDRCSRQGEKKFAGAFANGGIHMMHVRHWGYNRDNSERLRVDDYDLCFDCAVEFEKWFFDGIGFERNVEDS